MPGIFICYRREDAIGHAGRLHDRLVQHFGPGQPVFMDIDSVEPGEDFVDAIQGMVTSCDVLLVVIGRHWLTATDEDGQQRLEQPHDFVRLEIEAALDRNIRVIPTLVGGARMPRSQDLPDALNKLARRQAIEISDSSFHPSVTKLIAVTEKAISAAQQQRQMAAKAMVEQTARKVETAALLIEEGQKREEHPGELRNLDIAPSLTGPEQDTVIERLRLAASSRQAEQVGAQHKYHYKVWIEGPAVVLAMIRNVQYYFVYEPNPLTTRSSDPDSKFAVNYNGWGCYDTVVVTVQLKEQSAQLQHRTFNMCSALQVSRSSDD